MDLDEGLVVGFSGAGPKAAERCSSALFAAGCTALMSWGCAAALDPKLKPGDLVLPNTLLGSDGSLLVTDEAWHTRFCRQLEGRITAYSGLLAESHRIVARADEKKALFANTGAAALDMESAAAARAAQQFHVPFLATRSIIDPASVTIPPSIELAFDENGMLHVPTMLFHALLRPTDLGGIIRLGRHFGAAMKTLRQVAAIGKETHFAVA